MYISIQFLNYKSRPTVFKTSIYLSYEVAVARKSAMVLYIAYFIPAVHTAVSGDQQWMVCESFEAV